MTRRAPRRYKVTKSLAQRYDHAPKLGSVAEVVDDFSGAGWVTLLFRLETGEILMTVTVAVLAEHFEEVEA